MSGFEQDLDDLLWKRRAGHMGRWQFNDRSMQIWARLLKDNTENYYISRHEEWLIRYASRISADLIDGPVTFVARGCGTKFAEKDAILAARLRDVKGVVYIDQAKAVLDQSAEAGRMLFPHAWHDPVTGSLYDPELRYKVEGGEVNVSFGLTTSNIEGFPDQKPPKEAFQNQLGAMKAQMQPGAHLIFTIDANQDRQSIERAYQGKEEFAKQMLFETDLINPDDVDFVAEFHEQSHLLSHGYRFRETVEVNTKSGSRVFKKGETLWFNNSLKPPVEVMEAWMAEIGFQSLLKEKVTDEDHRLTWQHYRVAAG